MIRSGLAGSQNMDISPFARKVLELHAAQPQRLFYGTDAIGGVYNVKELAHLDRAYEELVQAGLMTSSGTVISYFGEPKVLYRVTDEGEREIRGSAA